MITNVWDKETLEWLRRNKLTYEPLPISPRKKFEKKLNKSDYTKIRSYLESWETKVARIPFTTKKYGDACYIITKDMLHKLPITKPKQFEEILCGFIFYVNKGFKYYYDTPNPSTGKKRSRHPTFLFYKTFFKGKWKSSGKEMTKILANFHIFNNHIFNYRKTYYRIILHLNPNMKMSQSELAHEMKVNSNTIRQNLQRLYNFDLLLFEDGKYFFNSKKYPRIIKCIVETCKHRKEFFARF